MADAQTPDQRRDPYSAFWLDLAKAFRTDKLARWITRKGRRAGRA